MVHSHAMKTKAVLLGVLFLCAASVFAQSAETEPVAIVELGGAVSRGLKDHSMAFGPDLAVETTPIENWLELEAGTTPLFSPPFN